MQQTIHRCMDAIRADWRHPPEFIKPDGKRHRFATKGKHSDDGWPYLSNEDNIPAEPFPADARPARSREVKGIDQRIAGESDAEAYLIVLPSTCVDGEELSGYLIRKPKGQPSDSLRGSCPTIERGTR